MAFSRFVDEQFVTENFPGEAETVNGITDFRKDKLKGKLRQRLPLRATCRPEMFKRIIYKGDLASGRTTPLDDGQLQSDNRELAKDVRNSGIFGNELPHFCWLNNAGRTAVLIILQRVRCDLPHVTKCPLLPLVVSVLVLYIDSLDDVFVLTERLLSDALCPLARSPNQALADDNTLRDLALLKLKSDKIRQWISSSQKATSHWREWLYSLPLPLLVSFVDCLLLEGPKIKFRFALAFLTLAKNFGFFDVTNSNSLEIRAKEAAEMLANERFDSFKILPKAFGIKRLSWNTCKTLISRHMVLLDISAERGIGTAYSTVSRLSQANAGEFFEAARSANSELVSVGDLARLIAILPPRFTVQQLKKIMNTAKDGYSLSSVKDKIGSRSDILVLIKPNRGEEIKLGAFLTGLERGRGGGVTGTGESFVFRIETEVESWIWTEGAPSLFACFDHGHLLVGNGALMLDSDLKGCSTAPSQVFSNPNLLSKNEDFQTFEVLQLELFAFTDYEI